MATSQAPAAATPPAAPRPLGPAVLAVAIGAVAAGALAVWQPLLGLGAGAGRCWPRPWSATCRCGAWRRVLVVLTALAAIAGPNLAAPPAPGVFLFRVLIVLLGLGLVGYLLMDGGLALPAGLPRPAGILGVWFLWSALSIGWADDDAGGAALDQLHGDDGRPGDRDRAALPRPAAGRDPALVAARRLRRWPA